MIPTQGMDRIKAIDPVPYNGNFTYHIRTESGDRYQVIQRRKDQAYIESIYFIDARRVPVCLRSRTFYHNEKSDFEQFIESGAGRPA